MINYITIDDLMHELQNALDQERRPGPKPGKRSPVKIAVSITGGGARGAYEAGALEAILQAFYKAKIRPDIITGTSVGALIGTALFTDLLYPKPCTTSSLYAGNQSWLWRKISDGNRGAEIIGGDRAWLIKIATNEQPLPVIGDIEAEVGKFKATFENFKSDILKLKNDAIELKNAATSFDISFGSAVGPLKDVLPTVKKDIYELGSDLKNIKNAWDDIDLLPVPDVGALIDFGKSVAAFIVDLAALMFDLSTGLPIAELATLFNTLDLLLSETVEYLERLDEAVLKLLEDFKDIILDDLELAGNLLTLELVLNSIVRNAIVISARVINVLFEFEGGFGVAITDHLIGNGNLRSLLRDFMLDSFKCNGMPEPSDGNISGAIIEDWSSRMKKGNPVPELFVTASNLTSSRLTVFSVADLLRIRALAKRDIWTVDLKSWESPLLTENTLQPVSGIDRELLVDATVTSASLPIAFSPMKWKLQLALRLGERKRIEHTFVDGGVLDNTPLDLAVYAGATHIISLELDPLIRRWPQYDKKRYNLGSVFMGSFNTSMDGSMRSSISALIANNKASPLKPATQIYRLAPLIPAVDENGSRKSPSAVDFDGFYDADSHKLLMSLYDWFMQGYIDAKGEAAIDDPIYKDYQAGIGTPSRGYIGNAEHMTNKFWRATEEAWPIILPY